MRYLCHLISNMRLKFHFLIKITEAKWWKCPQGRRSCARTCVPFQLLTSNKQPFLKTFSLGVYFQISDKLPKNLRTVLK